MLIAVSPFESVPILPYLQTVVAPGAQAVREEAPSGPEAPGVEYVAAEEE